MRKQWIYGGNRRTRLHINLDQILVGVATHLNGIDDSPEAKLRHWYVYLGPICISRHPKRG